MRLRRSAAAIAAVFALAACGSSGGSDTDAGGATVEGAEVAVGAAPAPVTATAPAADGGDGGGSIGDAIEIAAGAPGDASDAACTIDRQTLESAVLTYEVLNGALPTSQQELIDAQVIRELSVRYDVTADGTVVAATGGPCV
jgi:hypothetical protein